MNVFLEYLVQNWGLILILIAFVITLAVTVFLDKKTVGRMYILIALLFALSIIVYTEFHLSETGEYKDVRLVMMAIRYSATPIVIAWVLFTLVKKARWYMLLPSLALAILNFVSIPTGIVFSLGNSGELIRGALGYLPYIGVGVYAVVLIFVLIWQSNKQPAEIIPIAFLALAFSSGLVLPFIMGKEYSKIFCTTIGVALFVYYVFLILQLTKKDALTGLLNRQAYYAEIHRKSRDISAIVSIDMNGLKAINDTYGHLAGDNALTALANCFQKAATIKQPVYRIGGDEFIILCRKTGEEELILLIERIRKNVEETPYSCSIGYCYAPNGIKNLEEMAKESDEMMYADKAKFYSNAPRDRRSH